MRRPVYAFSDVLRALRNQAGLTILDASEAVNYGNYERWESGQTRVGPQYLDAIARAFHVGPQLYLFLYGWLLDRFTPLPGSEPFEVGGPTFEKIRAALPADEFDLG